MEYSVRHDHFRKQCTGTLRIDDAGITFTEAVSKRKEPHRFHWSFPDIQQLSVAERRVTVVTYDDVKWKLNADRGFRFDLTDAAADFRDAYAGLKDKLDQRFVAQLADPSVAPLWKLPVKYARMQGTLIAGEDRLIFETVAPGRSRTWRFADIDNIATSGPFDFTILTHERSRIDYGSRRGFHFQLKEPLAEARYDELWKRLNRSKGLKVLTFYESQGETK